MFTSNWQLSKINMPKAPFGTLGTSLKVYTLALIKLLDEYLFNPLLKVA